ncbi:MAG: hypothetical protein ACI8Q1_002525 [Parvicella sp.]|jgi:hypothetical protein
MIRLTFILCVLFSISGYAQENYTISGTLTDGSSGEALIGARIQLKDQPKGALTNVYGFYSLTLPAGTHEIVFSFVGFERQIKTIELTADVALSFELAEASRSIKEFVVEGESQVESMSMSKEELGIEQIKGMPALMGEVDVIKAIQMLPGVQTIGEGGSGFFVRGGGADQNLILLDEANVYNASHLLGFFSVFNPDAVKNVELYKGGIPAQYGGRLASVLDIRMREGNNKKLTVDGGIGTISSRLTITAPIKKNKGAFMISGRRTYADVFLVFSKNPDVKNSTLYFYDANLKANYTINDNNRVYLSGYFGRDVFGAQNQFQMDWGNATGTARWNHIFNSKLFLNSTVVFSNYNYFLGTPEGGDSDGSEFSWRSNIKDYYLKEDFNYYLNSKNSIKFGLHTSFHEISPGDIGFKSEGIENTISAARANSLEHAIYASNEQKISTRFSAIYGLRYSLFQNIGKGTVFGYDSLYNVQDTSYYQDGEIYQTYGGLEPRLGLKYSINETSSVKASYNRTRQYIQLASNSTSSSPLDVWFSSSKTVKPQYADQVAIGYFRNFKKDTIEVSTEVYYKKMYNAIDFKDHAQLLLNPYLEGELRFGTAYSYGFEFMTKKTKGKWSGWFSYTYSRVFRQILEINGGNKYPAQYDQPHNLSFVTSYEVNKRLNLALNFVYNSGRAVTMPTGRYYYQGKLIPIYSAKNAERLPDYHRMDISATLKGKNYGTKKVSGEWVFSIYNVYNRANAFSVNFRENPNNPNETQAEMLYLFKIIPSITYNFKF